MFFLFFLAKTSLGILRQAAVLSPPAGCRATAQRRRWRMPPGPATGTLGRRNVGTQTSTVAKDTDNRPVQRTVSFFPHGHWAFKKVFVSRTAFSRLAPRKFKRNCAFCLGGWSLTRTYPEGDCLFLVGKHFCCFLNVLRLSAVF